MLIVGSANIQGNDYFMLRLETPTKIGWYLFNKTITTDAGNEYKIDIDSLLKFKQKNIKPFLVSAYESTLDSIKYYGNPYLVNSLVLTYTAVRGHKFSNTEITEEQSKDGLTLVTSGLDDNGDYLTFKEFIKGYTKPNDDKDGISNNILSQLNNINLFAKNYKSFVSFIDFRYKGITLEHLYSNPKTPRISTMKVDWEDLQDELGDKREVHDATMAEKQKSLAQLRLLKDLSWYYDKNGRTKKNYKIINTIEDLKQYSENIFPEVEFWSVDVETTGLNEFFGDNKKDFDHIVSIMMSWEEDQAIFIPIDMAYMKNIPLTGQTISILKYWLEKIPSVGHNIAFDARSLLVDFGIKLNFIHDTQQLNFNLNCHRAKFNNGLKYLEEKLLKVFPLELKEIFGSNKLAGLFRYIKEPELALIYACPDVEHDLRIFKILWKQLPVSARKGYKLDMEVMPEVVEMDAWGNKVNIDLAKKLREANNKDRHLLEEMIYSVVGQTMAIKSKMNELADKLRNNEITEQEVMNDLDKFQHSDDYKDARYKFDINSGKELGNVLFKILQYPLQGISQKSKLPKVDAKALGALMKVKNNNTIRLKKDIISHESNVYGEKVVLIKAKEYNEATYPLALLITEYRLRNKRDTTFYKQLLDNSIDGRVYYQSKLASAETYRIINVIQTLQGAMKKMIIPYDKDHYLVVFDFSQIEYRFMAGLGRQDDLSAKLNNFRADFHKECCALLHKIKAYLVTHSMRKKGKSLNFAIPYGMGEYSIAENLYGNTKTDSVIKAREQFNTWKKTFPKIWDYLEGKRAESLENGYVTNPLGRRRYFYNGTNYGEFETDEESLAYWKDNMSKSVKNAVKRAGGNSPIQSGAADLFKMAMRDYRRRLRKEGLDKLVKTTAVIHDEMVNSVHKSVNPYYLYKIIWEEVMKQVKGHPRYFAGISVCDNWYEGKDDLYEAPIEFVDYIINSDKAKEKFVYQEDAKNNVLSDIKEYMNNVFLKEFGNAGLDLSKKVINLRKIMDNIEDYFIRDKISVYYELPKYKGKVDKEYENDGFIRGFEQFVLQNKQRDDYLILYPKDYPKGEQAILTENSRTFQDVMGKTILVENYIENANVETEDTKVKVFDTLDFDNLNLDLTQGEVKEVKDEDLSLDLTLNDTPDDALEFSSVSDDTGSMDVRINQLRLFEIEEEGEEGSIFSDDLYFIPTQGPTDKDEQAEIRANPDKFIHKYDSLTSNAKLTPNRLIVKIDKLSVEAKESLVQYVNEHLTTKDDLGGVEFVRHIGNSYDYTGVYVKGISIEDLRNIVDVSEVNK